MLPYSCRNLGGKRCLIRSCKEYDEVEMFMGKHEKVLKNFVKSVKVGKSLFRDSLIFIGSLGFMGVAV